MGYDNAKWAELGSWKGDSPVFAGGEVNNTPAQYIKSGESPLLRNVRLKSGATTNRPWSNVVKSIAQPFTIGKGLLNSLYISSVVGTYIGAPVWPNENPVNVNLTLTADITPYTSANAPLYVTAGNDTYIVSQSFPLRYFDKTTGLLTTVLTVPPAFLAFQPSCAVYYERCLWVAGFWPAGDPNSAKICRSTPDVFSDFNSATSDVIGMPDDIIGLASNIQSIFAFSKFEVFSATRSSQITAGVATTYVFNNIEGSEGALNQKCIVTAGNSVWYVTPSMNINRLGRADTVAGSENQVSGYGVSKESRKQGHGIQTYLQKMGITANNNSVLAFGYYMETEQLIAWHFSVDGVKNSVTVLYDLNQNEWLIDDNKEYKHAVNNNGANYALSSKVGIWPAHAIILDENNNVPLNDCNLPYTCVRRSKEFTFGDRTRIKRVYEARTQLRLNGTLNQKIYCDGALMINDTINPFLTEGLGWGDTQTLDIINKPWHQETVATFTQGGGLLGSTSTDAFVNLSQAGSIIDHVVTKDFLNQKFYVLEIVWESTGSFFELTDFDVKVEMLAEKAGKF